MIKVGFDISQIAHPGGVATYTKNLSLLLQQKSDLEMVYFYSSLRIPYKGKLKNVKKFKLPPTLFEVLFNKVRNVNIEKFLGNIDVFHSSDWVQPPTKAKTVTTIHDVIPFKYPEWSNPKIVDVHQKRLKLVEKEVDMVIAVSESTKKDLLEISKIPAEKIRVIYEGVSDIYKPQNNKDLSNFKKKYNLPEIFLLAIGGIGERRNLKRVKRAAKGMNLIITGESLPFLPDEEMPLLYGAASILVYPSLYEGFGLPILEAMACGTPVVTSNVSSMPEVGGDAAIYVDPENEDQIKQSIEKILKDKELQKKLREKGIVQAKKFSWQKCADETAGLYKELVNG